MTAQLFPPSSTSAVSVKPTTDWVLFRRRRREECEAGVPPPQISEVAAVVATVASGDEAKAATERLRSGATPDVVWHSFGPIAFEPGTATLATGPEAVRSAYDAAGGGASIIFAGYRANGTDPTAVDRARAVTDSLPPDANLDPGAVVDVVTGVPSVHPVDGTDGTLFVISYQPEVTHDCVAVAAVQESGQTKDLIAALEQGDANAVAAAANEVQSLGEVVFDGTTAEDPSLAQVAAAYTSALNSVHGQVGLALVWTAKSLDQTATQDALARVKAVADKLGIPPGSLKRLQADFTDTCTARIYLIVRAG